MDFIYTYLRIWITYIRVFTSLASNALLPGNMGFSGVVISCGYKNQVCDQGLLLLYVEVGKLVK